MSDASEPVEPPEVNPEAEGCGNAAYREIRAHYGSYGNQCLLEDILHSELAFITAEVEFAEEEARDGVAQRFQRYIDDPETAMSPEELRAVQDQKCIPIRQLGLAKLLAPFIRYCDQTGQSAYLVNLFTEHRDGLCALDEGYVTSLLSPRPKTKSSPRMPNALAIKQGLSMQALADLLKGEMAEADAHDLVARKMNAMGFPDMNPDRVAKLHKQMKSGKRGNSVALRAYRAHLGSLRFIADPVERGREKLDYIARTSLEFNTQRPRLEFPPPPPEAGEHGPIEMT